MTSTRTTPLRVVIAGGGVAGLEALLALRALAPDRLALTLVAPDRDFVYRPLAVAEPFSRGQARRYPLRGIADATGADIVQGAVVAVDDGARVAITAAGERLPYDALLLAVGARAVSVLPRALCWDDADTDRLGGVLRDIEQGYSRRLAVVVPSGPVWPLPAYELALMIARQAWGMSAELELTLVTPEPRPLARFGARASAAVADDLRAAGVTVECGAYAETTAGHAVRVALRPSSRSIEVDRVVALPVLHGRAVEGVPHDGDGFVAVDRYGKVPELERVWAAGDGTAFPVKFGGLAAEQADAAASAIAALADPAVPAHPFRPILRGRLLTGRGDRWMRHDPAGGAGDGVVADHTLWWPPGKVAGRWLAPYLAREDDAAIVEKLPESRGLPVQMDLERELLFPIA
jgi:sulfide:quinone oxidoreductase